MFCLSKANFKLDGRNFLNNYSHWLGAVDNVQKWKVHGYTSIATKQYIIFHDVVRTNYYSIILLGERDIPFWAKGTCYLLGDWVIGRNALHSIGTTRLFIAGYEISRVVPMDCKTHRQGSKINKWSHYIGRLAPSKLCSVN